jgi:hypothetical protein
MRTLILVTLWALVLSITVPAGIRVVAEDAPQSMTVRGQIWDSTCAAAGSHGRMMTRMNFKDVKECTLACVKAGAQFVLYDTDDKTIYRLDSQDKAREYAGQTVTVIGTYDRAAGTIHVDRIESVM